MRHSPSAGYGHPPTEGSLGSNRRTWAKLVSTRATAWFPGLLAWILWPLAGLQAAPQPDWLGITPKAAYRSEWKNQIFRIRLVSRVPEGSFSAQFLTPDPSVWPYRTQIRRPLARVGDTWTLDIPGTDLWIDGLDHDAFGDHYRTFEVIGDTGIEIQYHPPEGEPETVTVLFCHALYTQAAGMAEPEVLSPKCIATERAVNVIVPVQEIRDDPDRPVHVLHEYLSNTYDFVVLFFPFDTVGVGLVSAANYRAATEIDAYGVDPDGHPVEYRPGLKGIIRSAQFANWSGGQWVLHELGHRWGNFLTDPELHLASGYRSALGAHNVIGDQPGILDANQVMHLEPADAGMRVTTTRQRRQLGYSDLELYLMGLLSRDEFPPHWFYFDASGNPSRDPIWGYPDGTIIPYSDPRLRRVGIEDLERVYGRRVPVSGPVRKNFRAAFVLVSESPAARAELHLLNILAAHYASESAGLSEVLFDEVYSNTEPSFFHATRGRGRLDTLLFPRGRVASRTDATRWRFSATALGFHVGFVPGAGWRIESSADLRTWTPLLDSPGSGAWFEFVGDAQAEQWFRMIRKP